MPEPVAERSDYYVYVLYRADGVTPFYVGKGRGGRVQAHARPSELNREKNSIKTRIARKVVKEVGTIPYRVAVAGVTEVRAHGIETLLIDGWGRIDIKTGILANMTNGGEGASGNVFTPEQRARQSESALKPETRAQKSAALFATFARPEVKAKLSAGQKRARQNPETAAKLDAIRRASLYTPEAVEKRNINRNIAMQSPEYRAKLSASTKAYANSDEGRAARSRAAKIMWEKKRAAKAAAEISACT